MSKLSRTKANAVLVYTKSYPQCLDYIFAALIGALRSDEDKTRYLETANWNEIELQRQQRIIQHANYLQGWQDFTTPKTYFEAIEEPDYRTRDFDMSHVAYCIRLKKELKPYVDASALDDFQRLLFNGRIDQYISSQYPGYTPKVRA